MHKPPRPPHAALLRSLIESFDHRLTELFEQGDEPDDETIRAVADVEMARQAAVRLLKATDAEAAA